MKQQCRLFLQTLEDYLACHAGTLPAEAPLALGEHGRTCRYCRGHWTTACRSRDLLASLAIAGEPPADEYFYARLRARLASQASPTGPARLRPQIRMRHLVLAGALFAATLGSFAYNLHRIETPNTDEAMALDVPHINPQHPYDSHVRPQLTDAMLNLMNP